MAIYSWRERPLMDRPMARVVEVEFGNGKVRYAVETYSRVILANFRSEEKWEELRQYRRKENAEKRAKKLAEWMLSQAVKARRIVEKETT